MIPDQLDQSEYFAIVNWRNELAKLGPDR
jgi:hypothetical protein